MSVQVEYAFEWDAAKAFKNHSKHGISFEDAGTLFRDPNTLSFFDTSHSQKEDRWITMGLSEKGVLMVASHTFRALVTGKASIRLISVRKANAAEARQYRREKI